MIELGLVTYWYGISKSLKLKKAPTHPVLFSCMERCWGRVRWVSTDMGVVVLLLREPWAKSCSAFMDPELGRSMKERAGIEKYWVLSESTKSVSNVSPLSPHQGGLGEAPEDLCSRPQVKGCRNAHAWVRNVNIQREWLARVVSIYIKFFSDWMPLAHLSQYTNYT